MKHEYIVKCEKCSFINKAGFLGNNRKIVGKRYAKRFTQPEFAQVAILNLYAFLNLGRDFTIVQVK